MEEWNRWCVGAPACSTRLGLISTLLSPSPARSSLKSRLICTVDPSHSAVAKIPIGLAGCFWRKRNVVRSRQTGSVRRCDGKTDPCQGGRRGAFRGAARTLTSTASDALACTPRIGPVTAEVLRTARAKPWPSWKDLSPFGSRPCTIWTPICQEHSARCRVAGEP